MPDQFCPHCAEQVYQQERYCEQCGAWVANQRRDRVEVDVGVAAGVSDRGRRHHRNEDALALRDVGPSHNSAAVAIVCDGVSSSARPDEASETAAEVAADSLMTALHTHNSPAAATRLAIHAADQAVTALAKIGTTDGTAPACTYISAIVTGDTVTIGWVGDSRAYWIPSAHADSTPTRLTRDDSWLAQMVETGILNPAQAAADRRAHAITAWLGEDRQQIDPHIVTIEPDGPGVVVICTDGLWNYLDTVEELAAAVPAQALQDPLGAARQLVEVALRSGGRDNVTVAVLPFASDLVNGSIRPHPTMTTS